MNFWLPDQASTFAGDIDAIFYAILIITGIVFIVVEAALIYFIFKYRSRDGRKAEYIHGSTKAEVVWTIIPALILIGLGIASGSVWSEVKDRRNVPEDALEMRVEAKQFEWTVTYPGSDGRLDTGDDFTRRNEVRVPVDQPVVVHLGAEDVIHSFFVPEFRVKQDATPGMIVPVWFEATKTGEYELACAELCGLGHYRMRGTVRVVSAQDYERWVAEQAAE